MVQKRKKRATQKSEWVKVNIRREKLERIKNYLDSPIWRPAQFEGIKNPSQFLDDIIEKELVLFEDVEIDLKTEEVRKYYEHKKDELKKQYGIDDYKQYVNFVFSKINNDDFKKFLEAETHTPETIKTYRHRPYYHKEQ